MANNNGVGRLNNAKANKGAPMSVFNTQPTARPITKIVKKAKKK